MLVVTLWPGLIFIGAGLVAFQPGKGGKLSERVTGIDHAGRETVKVVFAVLANLFERGIGKDRP